MVLRLLGIMLSLGLVETCTMFSARTRAGFTGLLSDCFDRGAETMMLVIARWLNDNNYADGLDVEKFIRVLKKGGEEARQMIRRSLKQPCQDD